MPFLYFDASALVKLVLNEDGSDLAVRLWHEADEVVASAVATVEVRSALAAAARDGRISRRSHADLRDEWLALWAGASCVQVRQTLLDQAAALAERASLRALDAVHLASALTLDPALTIFTSWDERLRAAAAAHGLGVAPP